MLFIKNKKRKPQIVLKIVKKNKFKRYHKSRIKFIEFNAINSSLRFGKIGLQILKPVKLQQKHILTFRSILLRKNLINNARDMIWIRGILNVPVTKKPNEIRMGKGKGPVNHWICKIRPGKVFLELKTKSIFKAKKILFILTKVLGVPCQIVYFKKHENIYVFA